MQTVGDAKQQILMLKQLPPFSATAARLLEILSNDNLSLAALAKIIGHDPTVSARILGVANSAYFGQTTPVLTVEDAIVRVLGFNMVKSLAFSIALSGAFNTARCRGFDLEAYWFRSLATAQLSREVYRQVADAAQSDLDGVYLAGLLFDIGTLVLVHLFPDAYARVLQQLRESPSQDSLQLEQTLVGINSRQAGAWLTDRWHLPRVVVQVLAQSPRHSHRCEIAVVALASDLVRTREDSDRQMPWVLEQMPGITQTMLRDIETQCCLRDDELRTIANVMLK
jgi:HD-like signal output (HDOD) protein